MTQPKGREVVTLKARTEMEGDLVTFKKLCANTNLRKQWEHILHDVEGFDNTQDWSY